MTLGDLSNLLRSTNLQRFQRNIEWELGITKISDLIKRDNLDRSLASIGMHVDEVAEFKSLLEAYLHSSKPNSLDGYRLKKMKFSLPYHLGGSKSLPSSPSAISFSESGTPLIFSTTSDSSATTTTTSGIKCETGEVDQGHQSQNRFFEACGNEKNEEYVVWHKIDDQTILKDKANAFKNQIEAIYTEFPNKFKVPQGQAVDIEETKLFENNQSGKVSQNSEHSPTNISNSTESEKTPSKLHNKFKFHLKSGLWKSKNSATSTQNEPSKSSSSHWPVFFRQKSHEEKATKNGNINSTSGPSGTPPLNKIQEVFSKGKNKHLSPINILQEDDECKDLNIKPMSATAEKEMREALEEVAKCRNNNNNNNINNNNNNSPLKTPSGKSNKDSPTSLNHFFKFPHLKTSSSGSNSSQEKSKSKNNSGGKCSPVLPTESQNTGSSFHMSAPTKQIEKFRHSDLHRHSSTSSSSSSRSSWHERGFQSKLKIKSRHSRRTISESYHSQRVSSFVPYLPIKSYSQELKTFKKKLNHSNSFEGDIMLHSGLHSNPLLSNKTNIGKLKKQLSLNKTPSEFIIRFKSSLSINNEHFATTDDSGTTSSFVTETSNSSGSDTTVVAEDSKSICGTLSRLNRQDEKLENNRNPSPPPLLPPRAPVNSRSKPQGQRTCPPTQTSGAPIQKKRSFSERDSTGNVAYLGSANGCPNKDHLKVGQTFSLTERPLTVAKGISDPPHPAVYGLPSAKHVPKLFNINQGMTCKSYEHIHRKPLSVKPLPSDQRYSADASVFATKIGFDSGFLNERSETDSTISNSSTDCELEESTSYEDLMEEALDYTENKKEDITKYIISLSNNNISARKSERMLEEWLVPMTTGRRGLSGKKNKAISTTCTKAVVVGNF